MAGELHPVRIVGEERHGRETRHLIRLHILVEGQTEEAFVNRVLAATLAAAGVVADACRITTGRRRGRDFRGGFVRYEHLAGDLILRMKQDSGKDSWFTTMVDLYRLPKDFPGAADIAPTLRAGQRIDLLEQAFAADIARRLNDAPVVRRFIPYIQQHEFEALLFADPGAFSAAFPDHPSVADVRAIRDRVATPEDIDDGPASAPSRRILDCFPDYQKVFHGVLIAESIGIAAIRRECPRFDAWLTRLLYLSAAP
ncbi:MAG: DUF4276 family protein [Acetobacteraceae bacterium]